MIEFLYHGTHYCISATGIVTPSPNEDPPTREWDYLDDLAETPAPDEPKRPDRRALHRIQAAEHVTVVRDDSRHGLAMRPAY